MRKKMLFNGIFFFGLHKAKKAVKAKKGQKIFFAKSLRIVQFGEKSNKIFFVGLAFKAKTILAQGSKGLFYDENPFLSIKYSLYSNIRHTSFLNFFILYSIDTVIIKSWYKKLIILYIITMYIGNFGLYEF